MTCADCGFGSHPGECPQPFPPIRFSHLKAAGRSPAHARLALMGEGDDETRSMERGSATHALLFETVPVVAYPGAVRRGKEWEAFQANHADDLIVTAADYEKANRMADAVRANYLAQDVLRGTREKTLLWKDGGRECRATPDVADYLNHVTELKTCATADPQRFTWQALRMHYHAQLAWYLDAVVACGLGRPQAAYIVAVESSAPWPVTVLRLTDRALEAGRRACRLWFERLRGCERTGEWPAYSQSVLDLDVPDEFELDFGDSEAA